MSTVFLFIQHPFNKWDYGGTFFFCQSRGFIRLSLSSPLSPVHSSQVRTPQLHVTCCLFITQNTCLRLEARISSGLLSDFQDSYKLIFRFFFAGDSCSLYYLLPITPNSKYNIYALRIQNICNLHCDPKICSVFSLTHSSVKSTRNTERTSVCGAGTVGARDSARGVLVAGRGRSGARSCQESEVGGAARQAKVAAAAGAGASRTYRHRQILAPVFLTSHSPTPPANTWLPSPQRRIHFQHIC